MVKRSTGLVAAIIGLAISLPVYVAAQDASEVLQTQTPKTLRNSDVLALPAPERDAWIHGAATMLTITVARHDKETSGCLLAWAFGDRNGLSELPKFMALYPNELASSVVYAVAKQACPSL